jgi:hypothetical protein
VERPVVERLELERVVLERPQLERVVLERQLVERPVVERLLLERQQLVRGRLGLGPDRTERRDGGRLRPPSARVRPGQEAYPYCR